MNQEPPNKDEKEEPEESVNEHQTNETDERSYSFLEDGRLLDTEGNAFKFTTQAQYEKLCLEVTQSIYRFLTEPPYSLKKVPLRAAREEQDVLSFDEEIRPEDSFIFVSENFSRAEKLVVLIHGSGAVRAGQWSRRLILNDSLEVGSQLPYVRRCLEKGWAVLVMNTNENVYTDENGEKNAKEYSKDAIEHGSFVWTNIVERSDAKYIAIVAHSFGGMVTTKILTISDNEYLRRIRAICLTDAVFNSAVLRDERMKAIPVTNWITWDLPLDEEIEDRLREFMKPRNYAVLSAGTQEHERTSASAIDSIFRMIEEQFSTE